MEKVMKYALIDALGTAVYIILLVCFMFFGSNWSSGKGDTILVPIVMLMLFVFSAAFTGSLVFGRPIMWYADGKKREALRLLFHTLGIFLILTLVALIALMLLFAR